jgi:thymidylate synthase
MTVPSPASSLGMDVMSSHRKYENFAEAYRDSLRTILNEGQRVPGVTDPTSPGSGFGTAPRDTLELPAHAFEIRNPCSCLAYSKSRLARLPYFLGLLTWTMSGSDDLETIAYYNPRATEFSDDGERMNGAFGRRLFAYGGQLNQIEQIIAQLRNDLHSRRTAALLLTPQDLINQSREHSCALAVQYLVRENSLQAITYMRSQSAAMVLPYDVFLFASLQSIISQQLGLHPGSYYHISGSFHVYTDELNFISRILEDEITPIDLKQLFGPSIETGSIQEVERKVRTAAMEGDIQSLDRISEELKRSDSPAGQAGLIFLVHAYQWLSIFEKCRALLSYLAEPIQVWLRASLEGGHQ